MTVKQRLISKLSSKLISKLIYQLITNLSAAHRHLYSQKRMRFFPDYF